MQFLNSAVVNKLRKQVQPTGNWGPVQHSRRVGKQTKSSSELKTLVSPFRQSEGCITSSRVVRRGRDLQKARAKRQRNLARNQATTTSPRNPKAGIESPTACDFQTNTPRNVHCNYDLYKQLLLVIIHLPIMHDYVML